MKIKKIYRDTIVTDANGQVDSNIYIDTDSVFFSSVPLLDHRLPKWANEETDTIAGYVNDIATEMQDYLNDFYDILSEKVFNVDKTKHRFEIKKEYVSKAGIWIAKKRYAQWIISDNGVAVDKLDVKGLDVVRSSYPKAFRKFMGEILIEILRGDTEEQLTDKIHAFKADLVNMEVVEIAKAGGVKNLTKYMPKKVKQTAMFQFPSGCPAHVKASIAYNQLLKHYGVEKQFAPLKDGDKIKWVYLTQNPFGLDAVGFNGYNDPPQIIEFMQTYINYDKIFERELLKKLEDFYGALGWGAVLSSTKQAEKFFAF